MEVYWIPIGTNRLPGLLNVDDMITENNFHELILKFAPVIIC